MTMYSLSIYIVEIRKTSIFPDDIVMPRSWTKDEKTSRNATADIFRRCHLRGPHEPPPVSTDSILWLGYILSPHSTVSLARSLREIFTSLVCFSSSFVTFLSLSPIPGG